MIDFILFVITIVSVVLAASVSFYFRRKNIGLIAQIAQLLIDKQILAEQLAKEVIKGQAVENSDGFLRFVSESRDWAFQYIEEVQSAMNDIVVKNKASQEDIDRLKSLLPDKIENN